MVWELDASWSWSNQWMSTEVTLHSKWRSAVVQVHPGRSWLSISSGRVCRRITIWQSSPGYQIWFGSRDMSVSISSPFYRFRKRIPFHITTMWSHYPMNLEFLSGFDLCVGEQALEGSVWPPMPLHCFTLLPFKGCFDCGFGNVSLPIGTFTMGTCVPLMSRMQWTIWVLAPIDEVRIVPSPLVAVTV